MSAAFEYVFPAIRGIQAKREYFVSMCPLRLIPKIFLFNEEELVPELRAQRILNKNRLPEISRYIVSNRENYVFSAITASIDADVKFEPIGTGTEGSRVGLLHIPMKARFIINDGQHRRGAIEMALRENPELADESIAVVFFLDIGLERSQQMFADLNRYAIRPAKSLGVLYDHRDELANVVKLVVATSPIFRNAVELERSTLSARSRKLFTLSALYSATLALMANFENRSKKEKEKIAADYWEEVATHFPEWELVRKRTLTAGEVRRDFIHSHGVVLQALGHVGNTLLHIFPNDWNKKLQDLETLDWSRSNSKVWEGRALIGGRVSKVTHNVVLTTFIIKAHLGLPVTPEEQRVEDAFRRGDFNARNNEETEIGL